ncbi:MAG: TonB-dependent receptor, partial [Bacteroidota bacterium]
FPALPMDLTSDDTWMFNAKHNLQLNKEYLKTWNTTVFASFVDHKMDNLLKNLDPRMLNASTDAQTKNYGARTEGQWMLKNGKLYLGADYKVEAAKGIREREFLMGPNAGKIVEDNAWQDSQISKTGIFTEYHFHKSTIMYVMSGRLEVNNAQVSDATPEFIAVNPETSITQINPGVSIGAVKNAKEGFNMGLWLGRAQRSGSLTERYINYFPVGLDPYEMVGNPSILPEVNNQVDINIGYRKSKTNIEVSAFGSYLQDYISSEIRADLSPKIPSSPGVRQFINLDKASMYGFELAWSQILIGGLQHSFNLAYTHGENTVDNEPLPEIAPLDVRYTLSGSYLDGKLNPEISFRYVMQQDRIATSYGETETPAFNLLDFKIEYQVLKTLKAVGGVNNLFDTAYYEHLNRSVKGTKDAINAPGRNVFIMLTLDLM